MTSTSQDEVFCHEVAKRSVARAALHLGIDFMSEEALDVMGDVLLSYLERFGRALSSGVESSGRTSAHVNVLDAFQAAKAISAPTVMQLHPQAEENGDAASSSATKRSIPAGWQDLAEFCFGPNWQTKLPEEKEEAQHLGQGKKMLLPEARETKKKSDGWDAPYPDEVPHFPVASSNCANPHKLPPRVVQSLHYQYDDAKTHEDLAKRAEDEASRDLEGLSDGVFTTHWGDVGTTTTTTAKRPHEDTADENDGPPAKRARIKESDNDEKATEPTTRSNEAAAAPTTMPAAAPTTMPAAKTKRPLYVPNFFPPYPQDYKSARLGRTVVEIVDVDSYKSTAPAKAKQEDDSLLQVRSSLVKLGSSHYWGSGWDNDNDGEQYDDFAEPTTIVTTTKTSSLQVPMGRVSSGGEADTPAVVPLGRASGSRVSKILEGSMDQYH